MGAYKRDSIARCCMKLVSWIVVSLCASIVVGISAASAEESKGDAPWSRSCQHYKTSRHFVSESTLYCLRQSGPKACKEQAQRFFDKCHYTGDFQRMSARMGARMLLVLALGSVPSLNHIDL